MAGDKTEAGVTILDVPRVGHKREKKGEHFLLPALLQDSARLGFSCLQPRPCFTTYKVA